jgi:hypothetical protein
LKSLEKESHTLMNHDRINRQNNPASLIIIAVVHLNERELLKSQVGRGNVKLTQALRV